ncbi:MAG: RNA polymerase sigma factor [Capsulimonadaceae bacterium]|nr:RNA polymerase sigma factor [Capsulimonadaceae bacterium]
MSDRCPGENADAQWVARARLGEEAAYTWLLDRYRMRAVRLATHVLRRDAEAEDVAQEAFIQAFRSLKSLSMDGSFATWLMRIVVRLCIDRSRGARWQREVSSDFRVEPPGMPGDSQAGSIDTKILVGQLLDQLPPPARAALVLRELEGMDYVQISHVLGVPVGTVRSRLNSARAQFRGLWLAACAEED